MHTITSLLVLLLAIFALSTGATSASTSNSNATWPLQSFHSTDIRTAFFNVTKNGKTELGYIFVTPWANGRSHPSIYQDDGQLVWQGPEGTSYGFRPQTLRGQPVIVYWEGELNSKGYGYGAINILNNSYQRIHKVTLFDESFKTGSEPQKFPSYIDFHEGVITANGSILVTAINITQADLQSVGGPKDGWVVDALAYEIDIESNKVLFRWSAIEHLQEIPLKLSQNPLAGAGRSERDPWNFFHINSVIKYGDSYLVSWRYACSVLLISKSGAVTWNLNGINGGDFKLGPDTNFCYQYGLRLADQKKDKITISCHNNDNAEFTTQLKTTTGLILDLDLRNKTVTLNRRLWDDLNPVKTQDLGSFQNLPNGHVLMNHGIIPVIEEYDENGALVMKLRYGYDKVESTYRVHRVPWIGIPKTKPSVKACRSVASGEVTVYVSWNGATGVESWNLYTGSKEGMLQIIATEPRNGFETIIRGGKDANNTVVVGAVGGPNNGVKSDPVMVGNCS
ncbi:hypothetical protein PRK78_003353 [Emydomyces testavorans]|uniref:ASST-domain-containing protein n=1 Tax=Emydomyces testavorans TaxID=2070801 RepID=A0AAF0DFW2_9EURO|nr:hypothetical protein PRK78_003353 [Emydomyces testavorans]